MHIHVTWRCYLNDLYLITFLLFTSRPPRFRGGIAFALHAEDQGSITGSHRIDSDSSNAKRSATSVSDTGPQ